MFFSSFAVVNKYDAYGIVLNYVIKYFGSICAIVKIIVYLFSLLKRQDAVIQVELFSRFL